MGSSTRTLGILLFTLVVNLGCAASAPPGAHSGADSAGAALDLSEARRRVVKLETRLAELEREQARRERTEMLAEQRRVNERLDRLIVLNERLLESGAQRSRDADSGAEVSPPHGAATAPTAQGGPSFKEKLKALMEELRDDPSPWRGGLSLEQSEALRVLVRPERSLDSQNPWRRF